MKPTSFSFLRGIPALVYAAWIGWLSSRPATDSAPLLFPHFDKVLHFLLYLGLGLAVRWAFPRGASRRQLFGSWAICVAYAFLDEFHQSFVPGRHSDPLDVLADVVGAAAAIAGWQVLSRCCRRR